MSKFPSVEQSCDQVSSLEVSWAENISTSRICQIYSGPDYYTGRSDGLNGPYSRDFDFYNMLFLLGFFVLMGRSGWAFAAESFLLWIVLEGRLVSLFVVTNLASE